MKILVTGGAGYVGSHVCKRLRKQGFPYLVYDDFSTGHREFLADGNWTQGDVADDRRLEKAFSTFQPDAVIHLAALATLGECKKRPEDCRRINIEGTRNVLNVMLAHNIRHIVFASSCAVYADVPLFAPISEDSPSGPSTVYGESKLAAERLLAEYRTSHNIRSVILRIFNVAGADPEGEIGERHLPETHLLPLAIAAALGAKDRLEVYGGDYPTRDGTAVRDYMHVSDVAEACMRAVKYLTDGGRSQIINLGSGIPTSVRQLLAAVACHAGKEIPVIIKPRREGEFGWLVADISRMQTVLRWQPLCSNPDTIVQTAWEWHRKQLV